MVQIIFQEKSNKRITRMICNIAVIYAIVVATPVILPAQSADLKTDTVAKQSVNAKSDLWDRLKIFHGDLCLGSIMGARMSLAAKDSLLKAGGTGRILLHLLSG